MTALRRKRMKLKLVREPSSETTTLGSLFIDGEWECWTLEDKVRRDKIYGETAIPAGTYKVLITWSPRFKRQLPLLVHVPGFDGIRIHPGNSHKDTEGCVLVGVEKQGESILRSREAFDKLYKKLVQAKSITIEIA